MMEDSDRSQLNATATAVAVLAVQYAGLTSRFDDMYKRLYNGGTGDITQILKRIDNAEKSEDQRRGIKWTFGVLCTACAVFLTILNIIRLLHGQTP